MDINLNHQYRIPRMRTISEAIQELKALDKNSAVTPYFVRQLCIKGVGQKNTS